MKCILFSVGVPTPGIGRMIGQLWRLLPDDQKEVIFNYTTFHYRYTFVSNLKSVWHAVKTVT